MKRFSKKFDLRPYELGVGILAGRSEIEVFEKPDVAIISTGDELVQEPGAALGPGQVRDINRFTLAEGVRQAGGDVSHVSFLPDDHEESRTRLRQLFDNNDLVITSGGISMGDYDFAGDVLDELEVDFLFHKVWQKPGKPLGFAVDNGSLFFALPGNVVSSMVNFELYVRPTILRMRGIEDATRQHRSLKAGTSFPANDRRTFFFRGKYETEGAETRVVPTGTGQGSHIMTSLAEADCLVEVSPYTEVEPGDEVSVRDLNNPLPINVKE